MVDKNCFLVLVKDNYYIVKSCNIVDVLSSYLDYIGVNPTLFIKSCKDNDSVLDLIKKVNLHIDFGDEKVCGLAQSSIVTSLFACKYIKSYYNQALLEYMNEGSRKSKRTIKTISKVCGSKESHKCLECGSAIEKGVLCPYCSEND